jgi:hypothetical protein
MEGIICEKTVMISIHYELLSLRVLIAKSHLFFGEKIRLGQFCPAKPFKDILAKSRIVNGV